jgi:Ca2+-binding EF-hand superfamily protein
MVYEACDKNSGRWGGKFMEKKKHKNPINQQYYEEKDFLIGRTIFLQGYKFQLIKADEYTDKYMEDNDDTFPEASVQNILGKIKKGAAAYNSLQAYVIALMKELDKNGDGVISFKEFSDGLKKMSIFVTSHEEHTLMRKFDHNNDGVISMEEFYNTLADS